MAGTSLAIAQEQGALIPINDLEKMALYLVKSGLFGLKTQDQAMALMLIAQAEGMHPAIAARDYHIIQGRHSLKADAMLARFITAGGKVTWHEYTDSSVSATFTHPQGGAVTVGWDMARAKQADLGSKDNWKKYPRQMLRARVISEGIRTVCPGVAVGVYTPEEVSDFDDAPKAPTTAQAPKKSQVASLKDKLKPAEVIEGEILPGPEDTLDSTTDSFIDEAQGKDIQYQLQQNKVSGKNLLSAFHITKLSDLKVSQLSAVYDYINGANQE